MSPAGEPPPGRNRLTSRADPGAGPRYHPPMHVIAVSDATTFLARGRARARAGSGREQPPPRHRPATHRPSRHVRLGPLLGRRARRRGRRRRDAHPALPVILAEPADHGNEVVARIRGSSGADRTVAARRDGERTVGDPLRPGWTAATGRPWRLGVGQGVYALTSVRPPRPAPGSARVATTDDRALLGTGWTPFAAEALQAMPRDAGDMQRSIDARVGADATRRVHALGARRPARSRSPDGCPSPAAPASAPSTPRPRSGVRATRRTSSPRSAREMLAAWRRGVLPVHRSREPDVERASTERIGYEQVAESLDDPVRRAGGRARLSTAATAGRRATAPSRTRSRRAAPCRGIREPSARGRSGR